MMNSATVQRRNDVILLKRSLLFIWAVWLSVVFLTNVADAGKNAGVLSESWPFASGNFKFINETTAKYGTPPSVNAFLFSSVILWEGIATGFFWRAASTYRSPESGRNSLYHAFTASLGLWGAFLIADELCLAYDLESAHLRLFTAHLATLMTIELLPEN